MKYGRYSKPWLWIKLFLSARSSQRLELLFYGSQVPTAKSETKSRGEKSKPNALFSWLVKSFLIKISLFRYFTVSNVCRSKFWIPNFQSWSSDRYFCCITWASFSVRLLVFCRFIHLKSLEYQFHGL